MTEPELRGETGLGIETRHAHSLAVLLKVRQSNHKANCGDPFMKMLDSSRSVITGIVDAVGGEERVICYPRSCF